jgi:hypothetical protein
MHEAVPPAPEAALRHIPEIVPAEILAPPMPHERRWLVRDECALVLDRLLRRLALQEARCRRVLGRIASVFLARRSHHRLGFARLGDYARERLGISARELQSVAHVVSSMERLPKIADAFERGDISWGQLRVIVEAATDVTQEHWLSLAAGKTVRALDALRKREQEALHQPVPSGEDDDLIDGEPRARFRLACPRRVSSSWRRAVELARQMHGADVPVWQAAEAIAAEALSAAGADLDRRGEPSSSPEPRVPADAGDPDEPRSTAPGVDWATIEQLIPDSVEALGRDVGDADAVALDERMRAVLRSLQRVDWQLGRLLRLFVDMRLHRLMGFESASRYMRERTGISARKGRALVRLERKSSRMPELGVAYRAGEISWVRALTVLPVLSEEHAGEWVERAKSVTVRRLVDEVEWSVEARDAAASFQSIAPPPAGATLVLSERQMGAREERPAVDAEVAFTAPDSVATLLRVAISAFAGDSAASWRGLERLLDHVIREWTSQPRHRDPIFARDGWRCAVPGCSSRRNLHDHHVRFRSRGGDNARDNRVATCAWHHLRGLHTGLVRATGNAPEGIHWQLGTTTGRSPFLELEGERYLREGTDLRA